MRSLVFVFCLSWLNVFTGFIGHQDLEIQKPALQSGTRVFTNPEETYFPLNEQLIRHTIMSKAPWLSQPGCQVPTACRDRS
jgi:hypothetical protein